MLRATTARRRGVRVPVWARLCSAVLAAAAAALLTLGHEAGRASGLAGAGCKRNYDYTGVQNVAPSSGIRAYLTTTTPPAVKAGHVAGWVGVGGPGLGPGGKDEWLQAGYSGFDTGEAQVYYEVALPNKPPAYHTVVAALAPSAKNLLTVLEVAGKQGSWQVFMNNEPVSPVISLPQSHDKFSPQALGETWNGGTTDCNIWGYGFGDVEVAAKPGGAWQPGKAGYRWQNTQQQSLKTASDSFTARSTASASVPEAEREPPLLGHGHLASKLIGHKVDTECVPQGQSARFQTDTLYLSRNTCAVLLGYAIAQPHAPKAGTATGLQVAETAVGVLRAIAGASGAAPARVDCRAVGLFYRALRGLGATSGEALALRSSLLQAGSHLSPPLSLPRNCPIH
jgi:hypothetical protein